MIVYHMSTTLHTGDTLIPDKQRIDQKRIDENYKIHCPVQGKLISEQECCEYSTMRKRTHFIRTTIVRKECRNCNLLQKNATQTLYRQLCQCGEINTVIQYNSETDTIDLVFHSHLHLSAALYGFTDEGYVEIDCGKFGRTHFHPLPEEIYEDLYRIALSKDIIISRLGICGRYLCIYPQEIFLKHRKQLSFGIGTRMIDNRGTFTRTQYK